MRPRAVAFACLLAALPLSLSSASAAVTDPDMTCAEYLKASAHNPKAHHAANRADAAVEARVRAFCSANPKMKAMDAEMTETGD